MPALLLDPDRLLPTEPRERALARDLYQQVAGLEVVSPHGHVDAGIIARDEPFADPATALISPDHYVTRLLHARGVTLSELGVGGETSEFDPRTAWRILCENWSALAGTPTRLWLEHQFSELFGIEERPSADSAMRIYDLVADGLASPEMRPRALLHRMKIESLATTESPLGDLSAHQILSEDPEWAGRVVPAFRPDELVDLESPDWPDRIATLGEISDCETGSFRGFLAAIERRRRDFANLGATSTDHAQATAASDPLEPADAERIYAQARAGRATKDLASAFRSHMLFEFARMSCDDGLVMQLHTGVWRNHDQEAFARFGPDIGADIPVPAEFVGSLRHILNKFGSSPGFKLVVFTVDDSTWSRELAPMAGYYPALHLGAPWWFLDAPSIIRRFREATSEICGFSKYAGLVDDARVLLSIAARHDMARRVDCSFLAHLVAQGRLADDEAADLAADLALGAARRVFRV